MGKSSARLTTQSRLPSNGHFLDTLFCKLKIFSLRFHSLHLQVVTGNPSMAKKTLFKLQFESEFRLIGLVCSESDYRFCWLLNRQLGYDFCRVSNFEFVPAKSQTSSRFSVFEYDREESLYFSLYLVNNRSHDGTLLFGAPAGLDFLLLAKADEGRFHLPDLLKKLRTLSQLQAAFPLDGALGKNKEIFLYDFEMFVSHEIHSNRKKDDFTWIRRDGTGLNTSL
jgi:hypothetical protein